MKFDIKENILRSFQTQYRITKSDKPIDVVIDSVESTEYDEKDNLVIKDVREEIEWSDDSFKDLFSGKKEYVVMNIGNIEYHIYNEFPEYDKEGLKEHLKKLYYFNNTINVDNFSDEELKAQYIYRYYLPSSSCSSELNNETNKNKLVRFNFLIKYVDPNNSFIENELKTIKEMEKNKAKMEEQQKESQKQQEEIDKAKQQEYQRQIDEIARQKEEFEREKEEFRKEIKEALEKQEQSISTIKNNITSITKATKTVASLQRTVDEQQEIINNLNTEKADQKEVTEIFESQKVEINRLSSLITNNNKESDGDSND